MVQVLLRNTLMLLGVVVAGAIFALAGPWLISPRGDAGPTILAASSPMAALLAIILCLAGATAAAAIVGKLVNVVLGLFVLGAGMFVLDEQLATVRALAFLNEGVSASGPLIRLVIEALVLAGLTLAAVVAMFKVAGPMRDVHADETNRTPDPLFSVEALRGAAAGIIMLLAVIVIARSPMKGQVIGATFVGGMLAGLVGRLISPHVQPLLLFISPIVFGALGYVVAMFTINAPMDAAYVSATLPALSLPMPLDYAVGSLAGVAVGLGWARSFLQHEETAPVQAAAG